MSLAGRPAACPDVRRARRDLTAALRQIRSAWPPEQARRLGLVYRGAADFVLRHGQWHEPRATDWPGAPRACFANAICLAATRPGWQYVEGYGLGRIGLPAIHHAWNLDAHGRLVDATWPTPGVAYLGVVFSVDRADNATWFGDASVLDDFNRRWPLLREPWQGEDESIEWETSGMLAALRAGGPRLALSLLEREAIAS